MQLGSIKYGRGRVEERFAFTEPFEPFGRTYLTVCTGYRQHPSSVWSTAWVERGDVKRKEQTQLSHLFVRHSNT